MNEHYALENKSIDALVELNIILKNIQINLSKKYNRNIKFNGNQQNIIANMYKKVNNTNNKKYLSREKFSPRHRIAFQVNKFTEALEKFYPHEFRNLVSKYAEFNPSDYTKDVDIKEMLKQQLTQTTGQEPVYKGKIGYQRSIDVKTTGLDINTFLGIDTIKDLQLLVNPSSLYTHYYIALDTNNRIVDESDPVTEFKWQYSPSINLAPESASSVGEIRDIVAIRLYQPRIPYVGEIETDANMTSIAIKELNTQGFNISGRKFHFLLRPDLQDFGVISTGYVELSTEDYGDGRCYFNPPITQISSFTIEFGNPLEILSFPEPVNRFIIAFEFTCFRSDKTSSPEQLG